MTEPRDVRGAAGMTLVELMVATVLFAAVSTMTYTTIVVVTEYNQRNDAQLHQESAYRRVFERLHAELRDATTERDPRTNLPRFSITEVGGRQALSFQKLVGATTVNGELTPLWSSAIVISCDAGGTVYRTQDGESVPIASGVERLSFAESGGTFEVTCVTSWRDSSGKRHDESHAMRIEPLN